jgi:hypothetical protein
VLEVGDSLGIDLGWGLSDELAASKHEFIGAAVGDTGLAEPWYYNWPAQLDSELHAYRPAIVIVFLGANDVESYYVDNRFLSFGSPAWARYYGLRVATMMDECAAAGAWLLWVGMPPMEDPSFSNDMAVLNAVYKFEATAHGRDVRYMSSWGALGGRDGQYEGAVPGPNGQQVVLRAPDGTHITRAGGDLLAKAVVGELARLKWL